MRHILLISFFLFGLNFKVISQTKSFKLNAIEVQYGLASSFMINQLILYPDTTNSSGRYTLPNSNIIPSVGRFEMAANFKIAERQTVNLGIMIKNYRYKMGYCGPTTCAEYDVSVGVKYFALQFSHQYWIANSNKIRAAIVNGWQLNIALSADTSNELRKFTIGYVGKFNVYYQINSLNSLVFSPEYTMAITRYNKKTVETAFRPYSFGLMIGFSHKV